MIENAKLKLKFKLLFSEIQFPFIPKPSIMIIINEYNVFTGTEN